MTHFASGSTSDVEAAAHGRELGARTRVVTRRSSAQRDGSPLAAALNGRPAATALAQLQRKADASPRVARAGTLAAQMTGARAPVAASNVAPVQAKGVTVEDTGEALDWADVASRYGDVVPELAPLLEYLQGALGAEALDTYLAAHRQLESTDLDDDDQDLIEELSAPIDPYHVAEAEEGLAERVDVLNTQLLETDDVAAVTAALQPFIPGLDEEAAAALKTYLFDNKGISANAANYLGWRRLATGQGTLDDARFLTHEFFEYGLVAAAAEGQGVAPTFARDQQGDFEAWNAQADVFYGEFHPQAFTPEYGFLADMLRQLTGAQLDLTGVDVARADPTRPEARRHLIPDVAAADLRGQHAEAAGQAVELDAVARGNLGLPEEGALTLGEVVGALKRVRLADAQAVLQPRALPGGGPRVVQRVADVDLLDWQEQLATRPELANFDADFQALGLALGTFDALDTSEEEVQALSGRATALGQAVLDADDVDAVRESLGRALGMNFTRDDVAALKRYEFDSDSNVLTAENLVAWRRLAAGAPTRDDVRFFVQQWYELQALRAADVGFDPSAHHGQGESFSRWYAPAHQAGLLAEMRFLAANLSVSLGRDVTWEQVARSDRERREEFLPALAVARGVALPDPQQAPPDLDALDDQFADDYDAELRDALGDWKNGPAGVAGHRTQVFTYLHGLQSSPRTADYWHSVGFVRVETQVGPVWTDPRNADEAQATLGAFDADAATHGAWAEELGAARGQAEAVRLPSREQIIVLHEQFPAEVPGFNYDNLDGALFLAAREPDLASQAAGLVYRVVNGHTFGDANKRTGGALLDWIMAHNRGGAPLLGGTQALLSRVATKGYSLEEFTEALRLLMPHAARSEPD